MPGPLVGDIGASMHTAVRILAALIARQRTGEGSAVDIAIHDAALAWSMFPTTGDLARACYTIYETADGEWLALGALEAKFWRGFCERIGRADLIPLQHAPADLQQRVVDDVRAIMRTRTRAEWLDAFADADVCLTPIYTADEVARDPHVLSRGALQRDAALGAAPALGADTDAVLEAAGIDGHERTRLRAAAVI
jgi:crotonobetainyl-CoA:carnitine CoA-transferase CaiB-like acyl-CoA transferase